MKVRNSEVCRDCECPHDSPDWLCSEWLFNTCTENFYEEKRNKEERLLNREYNIMESILDNY